MYALDTLFVASERTPIRFLSAESGATGDPVFLSPANVRFPLRVKLVFSAPVPA